MNRKFETLYLKKVLFWKNVHGISKSYHEVLLLMKFLQTTPQVKNMNIKYYGIKFIVTKNRDEKEIVNDKFEINENDYINYEDFITPNHFIGRKNNNEVLK